MTIAWSPGIRDESAYGIVRLLQRDAWRASAAAPTLRDALNDLIVDDSALVRMRAAAGLLLTTIEFPDHTEAVGFVRRRLLVETDPIVLPTLLAILRSLVVGAAQAVDDLLRDFGSRPQGDLLLDDSEQSSVAAETAAEDLWRGRGDAVEIVAATLPYLAVVAHTPFASERLRTWFANPLVSPQRLGVLLHFLRPYLNLPDGQGQRDAFDLVSSATDAVVQFWATEVRSGKSQKTDDGQARTRSAAEAAHTLAQQLYFASGAFDEKKLGGEAPEAHGDRSVFAAYSLPLIQRLASLQVPQVTHPLVETLVYLSDASPRDALFAVAEAIPAGGPYLVDQLAGGVVMPYLKKLLSEHQDLVLGDSAGVDAFRHILQAFAAAGQSEALALAYRFSDVFR